MHRPQSLVFSVDPQASLSDIFQRDIFRQGCGRRSDNLYAQEVDADRHIHEYQDQIRKKILDMYGLDAVPEEIEQYIQAASAEPAMEESAIFDAVVDIVVGGEYDYYIYDLVPLDTRSTTFPWPRCTTSGSIALPACARRCASRKRW